VQNHGKHDGEIYFTPRGVSAINFQATMNVVMAHEIGHHYGLDDFWQQRPGLDSIFAHRDLSINGPAPNSPTRHDFNAVRIGLNDRWFDVGNGNWWRQKAPGVWATNEWYDGSFFNANSNWVSSPNFIPNGTYVIRNRWSPANTQLNLDVQAAVFQNDTTVQVYRDNSNFSHTAQRWVVRNESNGTVSITPERANTMRLDVFNFGTNSGARVNLWQDLGTTAQRFHTVQHTTGFFHIIPSHATSMALNIDHQTVGTPVVLRPVNSGWHSQQWEFIRVA
jgi:hypothetical protein